MRIDDRTGHLVPARRVSTVDVGVAQLAMHSARELCGADDPSWYQASMTQFLRG